MTIYKGSRYENSTIDFFSVTDGGDLKPTVFYEFPNLGYVEYYEHTYQAGERLDSISYKYYKRSGFWWLIAVYNPQVSDFTNIAPGTVLKIPNV